MATAKQIHLPPTGPPSLTLSGGHSPTSDTKAFPGQKHFPSQAIVSGNFTTKDYKNTSTSWTASAGWSSNGSYSSTSLTSRRNTGINIKSENRGTIKVGPTGNMSNSNSSGIWWFDVIGMSHTFDRRECYWSECDMRMERVGMRFWLIDEAKEVVEICTLKSYGGGFSTIISTISNANSAMDGIAIWEIPNYSDLRAFYRRANYIWIGFYIQYHVYNTSGKYGSSARDHYMSIGDVAPIHELHAGRYMAPMEGWAPANKRIRVA